MARSIFLVFLIVMINFTVYGWILRNQCGEYAVFNYIKNNAVLQGSLLTTLKNKSPEECESACVDEYFCKSINTENGGERTCELNSESVSDPTDNVALTAKADWTFRSTNYTDFLVGKICKDQNPCGLGNLCMDTCECPGYICHRCPLFSFGYGCESSPVAIGIEHGTIPDHQMCSSSTKNLNGETYRVKNARLNGPGTWCANSIDYVQYIRIDFLKRKIVGGVAIQGPGAEQTWVKTFKLHYTEDSYSWKTYREYGVDKTFDGCTDSTTVVKRELAVAVRAFAVKINPMKREGGQICMRIEIYAFDDPQQPGIPQGCTNPEKPLGMASGAITNSQISATSILDNQHPAYNARLNHHGKNWCALGSTNQHLQVDLTKNMKIVAVSIQGQSLHKNWVTSYAITYIPAGASGYQNVIDPQTNQKKQFSGTTKQNVIVKSKLDPPITTRHIRILPLTRVGDAWCLRIELHGCDI